MDALSGAALDGVWMDVPRHRVTFGLRTGAEGPGGDGQHGFTDHTLTLEEVTDFGFRDAADTLWADARVAAITAAHDPDSIRVHITFRGRSGAVEATCGKAVLRRSRPATREER
ncbi:hypothetical protein DEF23_26115 [Marinitenerispora sediminis]|uniref:Uncharacterized protein n=1 Tax=Marinitenerispora sediminis TaxID=1931232 RepID=A0A368T8I1_9ACTN|nr:hypothetical protein DEF23_26115 [Marinitenerispora sediminis]RCV53585.1 hypothetical protein DEF28_10170 [Marinitenerispora sediminis]RCV60686.1 hypothetical protein DEF24_06495 [Marinitenerispora sediminis]